MGSETEPRSKCHVSTDGRSELHVRRKSLVCDSAGDGWTTMSDWVKLAQWSVGSELWYAVFFVSRMIKNKRMMVPLFFFFFFRKRPGGEDNGSQHDTSSWRMEEEEQKGGRDTRRQTAESSKLKEVCFSEQTISRQVTPPSCQKLWFCNVSKKFFFFFFSSFPLRPSHFFSVSRVGRIFISENFREYCQPVQEDHSMPSA